MNISKKLISYFVALNDNYIMAYLLYSIGFKLAKYNKNTKNNLKNSFKSDLYTLFPMCTGLTGRPRDISTRTRGEISLNCPDPI